LTLPVGFDTVRPVLLRTSLVALLCLLLTGLDWPKWAVRRRDGSIANRYSPALLDPSTWGAEPRAPDKLELPRLARALRETCKQLTPGRAEQYALWIDESARMHDEDPFLVAATMVYASDCTGKSEELSGIGLTGIQPEMYRSNVDVDMLKYVVREGDAWVERAKMLSRPLTAQALQNPQANLEWAAALLAMWREQHDTIDEQFEQAPHRHYVSHFLWGDRVQSARAEDYVFTARRRLLEHYHGRTEQRPAREFRAIMFGAPLEGAPRVVSSKPGADRDHGLRMHRGVDVDAEQGEPVLAMADGIVSFAGVDLPGKGSAVDLPPEEIERIPSGQMGAGGRYVCITHMPSPKRSGEAESSSVDPPVTSVPRLPEDSSDTPESASQAEPPPMDSTGKRPMVMLEPLEIIARDPSRSLISCYMHLDMTAVRSGQYVKRGESIGTVGRTGCKESAAHLHLELKSERELFDARDVLSGILIGDPPWRSEHEERRARRRARAEGLTSTAMTEAPGSSEKKTN
jgi:murein DD-endopeptidase MepM/ murein hydrolase activator NlpD